VLLYHAAWLAVPTILGSLAFVLVRRNLDEPLPLRDSEQPIATRAQELGSNAST
jgi:hypothetical protein